MLPIVVKTTSQKKSLAVENELCVHSRFYRLCYQLRELVIDSFCSYMSVGKASHSSVDCGETERNKQGQSVSDSGTATTDSTEKTQRNRKEAFTATGFHC